MPAPSSVPPPSTAQDFLEVLGVGVWELDHTAGRTTWSRALSDVLGYAPGALDGGGPDALLERLHPDDVSGFRDALGSSVGRGAVFETELRLRTADGRYLWGQTRGRPVVQGADGTPLRSVWTWTDISARKATEQMLALQQRFTHVLAQGADQPTLFRAILDLVLELDAFDAGGLYARTADGGFDLLAHVGLGQAFIDAVKRLEPGSPRAVIADAGKVMSWAHPGPSGQEPPPLRAPYVQAEGITALVVVPIAVDGRTVACLNLASRHALAPPPRVLEVLETLAQQFGQGLQRFAALEAADRRRRNLEGLFAAIGDLMFVLDADGVVRHVNPAAREALAHEGEIVGRPFVELHATSARGVVRELLAGQRTSCLVPLARADGGTRTVDARIVSTEWDVEPARLCVARDVTQEVEARLRAERGETLLRTTLDATADGILVVSEHGRVLAASPRFGELWRIPEELLRSGDDARLLAHVSAQLVDPEGFISEVRRLYGSAEPSQDTLRFNDGRVFERTSRAIVVSEQPARVWSFRDVTAREKTRQELEEERAFLSSLVRAIPDLVWAKDLNGIYLRCNFQFERFLGAREADIVGKTDDDFVSAELAELFRANDRRAVELDRAVTNEEWLTFAEDGYHGLFETKKTPLRAADGRVVGVLGVSRDITQQRRVADELRTREELYRTIVSQAADGIVLLDPETLAFVEHNEAAASDLGYTREEFAALRLSELVVGATEREIRSRVTDLIQAGKSSFDTRHIAKDGTARDAWVTNRAVVVHGAPHLMAVWRDTTERRRMDAQLRLSEERLSFAVQGSNDGLWDWNLDNDDVYFSPRCLSMVGYEPGELPGTLATWKRLVHPDDREPTLAAVDDFVNGRMLKYEVEFRLRHKDGHWVDVLSRATLSRDAAGRLTKPRRLIGTHFDLSERRGFERQLADASERWRVLFEQSRDGIVLLDQDGAVAEHNAAFAEMLGYSSEELSSKHVWDWDPTVSAERIRAALPDGGRDYLRLETQHHHRDGSVRDVEVRATRVTWASKPYLFCVVQDITPRKRAEELLRESEFFLRESQAIARVGGWKVNLDSNTMTWTEGTYRLFEHPLDAPASLEDSLTYYAPEERERVLATFGRAWGTGEPFDLEARCFTRSGKELWAEVRCTGRIDTAAGPFLAGTVQDLTSRKRVELELARHRQHLEELVRSRTDLLESANRRLTETDMRLSAMFSLSQQASELAIEALLQRGLVEAVRLTQGDGGELRLLDAARPDATALILRTGAEEPASAAEDDGEALWAEAARLGTPRGPECAGGRGRGG